MTGPLEDKAHRGGVVVSPFVRACLALTLMGAVTLIGSGAIVTSSSAGAAQASGTVDVLYCGSFLDLMEQKIGPAFKKATGYSVTGVSNGSSQLASEIKGGTQVGDVFISASPSVNTTLQGAANGKWVSTYEVFGESPLVLGYNASSTFAHDLTSRPWYDVVDLKGFLLGRTDPATDPKGVLAVDALRGVALSYAKPRLAALASHSSNIFEETALVGELQSGQLDGGFFYGVEAAAAHLKTVPLTGTSLDGQYTVAILKNAPHGAAAKAFVKFLLGKTGRGILRANGVTPLQPVIVK